MFWLCSSGEAKDDIRSSGPTLARLAAIATAFAIVNLTPPAQHSDGTAVAASQLSNASQAGTARGHGPLPVRALRLLPRRRALLPPPPQPLRAAPAAPRPRGCPPAGPRLR